MVIVQIVATYGHQHAILVHLVDAVGGCDDQAGGDKRSATLEGQRKGLLVVDGRQPGVSATWELHTVLYKRRRCALLAASE